jgi:hypothetical protein
MSKSGMPLLIQVFCGRIGEGKKGMDHGNKDLEFCYDVFFGILKVLGV